MPTFSRGGAERDPLWDRAERLLSSAETAAESMFGTFTKYYPELLWADEGKWHFLVTAAALYVASIKLQEDVPVKRSAKLAKAIEGEMPDHMARAMGNCRRFVERSVGPETDPLTFEWAVGSWVLSGLFLKKPPADRGWLAAAIGEALVKTFGAWWR